MNIKCFFGFHDSHVVGKCYKAQDMVFNTWIRRYAVMQCPRYQKVKLIKLGEDHVMTRVVTNDSTVVTTHKLEQYEKQLKADGWISYEDLVLTKGEYL